MTNNRQFWVVDQPKRLIDFLKGSLATDRSAKYLRRVLDSNLCRVNGKIERFASARLNRNDRIELSCGWSELGGQEEAVSHLSIKTLYEDEFFKVVDKPPGWVCNPESVQRTFGPGHELIHRLDKETSGLLLIAKTTEVKAAFVALFERKEITKLYLALADGIFSGNFLKKESFLVKKRTYDGQTIWGSGSKGLYACTYFRPLAKGQLATLFACQPITGRTHQIRVHLAEMGHPILVDRQYAERFKNRAFFQRPYLHAARLQFTHPITGGTLDLTAPLPGDMRSAIDLVGIDSSGL